MAKILMLESRWLEREGGFLQNVLHKSVVLRLDPLESEFNTAKSIFGVSVKNVGIICINFIYLYIIFVDLEFVFSTR